MDRIYLTQSYGEEIRCSHNWHSPFNYLPHLVFDETSREV